MAKELKVTTKYKKDLKAYKHKPDVILELNRVIDILISGGILPEKYKNHPLSGNLKDIYDCHVKPNDVLLYKINETEVTLIRFGPHNKLELTENNERKDTMIKLHIKEEYDEEASSDIMTLLKNIPNEDIDHHETDLYLRKTPEVTKNVINKLPDIYKKNVTTFRDQIDHDIWYEIPFVFPKGRNRKGVKESIITEETEKDFINDMATQISSAFDWESEKLIDYKYNKYSKEKAIDTIQYLLDNYKIRWISDKIHERSEAISTTDDPYEFENYFWDKIYDEALYQILDNFKKDDQRHIYESVNDIETWDISFWDEMRERHIM